MRKEVQTVSLTCLIDCTDKLKIESNELFKNLLKDIRSMQNLTLLIGLHIASFHKSFQIFFSSELIELILHIILKENQSRIASDFELFTKSCHNSTVNCCDINFVFKVFCHLIPHWSHLFTMAAPWHIELDEPWFRTIDFLITFLNDFPVKFAHRQSDRSIILCSTRCEQDENDLKNIGHHLLIL